MAGWSNATSTDPYSCVAIGNLMCGVGYHIFAEGSYGIWIYHAILNDHLCAALITAFIGGQVLLDANYNMYLYKEGVLRTGAVPYSVRCGQSFPQKIHA